MGNPCGDCKEPQGAKMSDTEHIQVTLQICGDPDNSGCSPHGGVYVTINSSDGINWEEAVRELTSKIVDWANSFIKYSGTNEITIRPGGKP